MCIRDRIVPVWVPADLRHDPLADIPRKGIGFGLLAWMRSDHPELRSAVAPIAFNFLGRLDSAPDATNSPTTPFSIDWNGLGEPLPLAMRAQHPIAILAHFEDQGMFVSVTIDYGAMEKTAATTFMESFEQALQAVEEHRPESEDIDMEALAASLGITG